MKVSCACLTYGRNALLNEAVESFIRQDFDEAELVVFNTLSSQELWCSHPRVRVINHTPRPASLGDTRNLCIEACSGEFILTWDDDDIYLPGYISWLVSNVGGDDWIKQARRFNMEGHKIVSITGQATNQMMFSKGAWHRAGGYPSGVDSGEDAGFARRLSESGANGRTLDCRSRDIGFCYGWSNGAFHISGCGVNAPGKATSWGRAANHVMPDSRATGRVEIVPAWRTDYAQMAKRFLRDYA